MKNVETIGGAIRIMDRMPPNPVESPLPLPWCTRAEAAEYLRFSTDWIDQRLVRLDRQHPGRVEGKMRFTVVDLADSRREGRAGWRAAQPIRIVSEDVIAILPPPPEEA